MTKIISSSQKVPSNEFEKKLDKMLDINYQIIVKINKNIFYLFIPELNLIAKGDDISLVYKNLQTQKINLFTDYIKIGVDELVPFPSDGPIKTVKVIKDFIIKPFFGVILILFFLTAVMVEMSRMIKRQYFNVGYVELFAQRLKKMSPESKQRLISSLHGIVNELKPVTNELMPLFKADDNK
ncbi:MAG: hypothetical protein NTX01_02290 [Candidatus Omnitrophica bacterium]|nr:hypothetical protein [Candidatus Omnitrophota bacterium]